MTTQIEIARSSIDFEQVTTEYLKYAQTRLDHHPALKVDRKIVLAHIKNSMAITFIGACRVMTVWNREQIATRPEFAQYGETGKRKISLPLAKAK